MHTKCLPNDRTVNLFFKNFSINFQILNSPALVPRSGPVAKQALRAWKHLGTDSSQRLAPVGAIGRWWKLFSIFVPSEVCPPASDRLRPSLADRLRSRSHLSARLRPKKDDSKTPAGREWHSDWDSLQKEIEESCHAREICSEKIVCR